MKGKSASPTPTDQFLSFSLNSTLQALLSAHQLAEIVRLDPKTIIPISEMPSAVIGVCPWQGEVLWLLDLAYLLGFSPLFKPTNFQSNCSLIKARTHRGNVGLWVEKVGELISCEPSKIKPFDAARIPTVKPHWTQGSVTDSDRLMPILDLDAILRDLVQE